MRFYIKDDTTGRLNKLANSISKDGKLNDRMIHQIGGMCVALIQQRTALGRDERGRSFKSYSDEPYYAPVENRPAGYPAPRGGRTKHKKTGRDLKTVVYDGGYGDYKAAMGFGSKPQLSVSGEMLGDMVFARWRHGVIIYFISTLSRQKAAGHHTGKFPFFGFSADNVQSIQKQLKRYVGEAIKKARAN